jgi:hypothetical protein
MTRPINNWFRKIEFSLMAFKASPMQNGKSITLGSFSLLNYDVLTMSGDSVKKITEEVVIDPSEKIIREASIEYKVQNLSSYESYLVDPNKNNYMEGKKMVKGDLSFSKAELKISMFRFRRCLNMIEIWVEYVNEIFRFKYKKWSYFGILFFHIILFLFNMNYVHINILLGIAVMVVLSHRKSIQFLYEHVLHNLRKPEDLNTNYWEPIVHTKTYLKGHRYLQIELLRKKLKPADGLVSDLKLIKLGFNSAPFILHELVNLFEKFKNLITWYETRRTKALLGAIIFAIVIFYLVPFKLFVLAWCKLRLLVWKKLVDNRKFYENHLSRNKQIVTATLAQIVVKFCGNQNSYQTSTLL